MTLALKNYYSLRNKYPDGVPQKHRVVDPRLPNNGVSIRAESFRTNFPIACKIIISSPSYDTSFTAKAKRKWEGVCQKVKSMCSCLFGKQQAPTPHITRQRLTGNRTYLHIAAENGDLPLARALIQKGASLTKVDNQGRTPLKAALDHNEVEVFDMLLAQEAQLSSKHGLDKKGETPLFIQEFFKGHDQMAVRLVQNKIGINTRDQCGSSPLSRLLQHHQHLIKMLYDFEQSKLEKSPVQNNLEKDPQYKELSKNKKVISEGEVPIIKEELKALKGLIHELLKVCDLHAPLSTYAHQNVNPQKKMPPLYYIVMQGLDEFLDPFLKSDPKKIEEDCAYYNLLSEMNLLEVAFNAFIVEASDFKELKKGQEQVDDFHLQKAKERLLKLIKAVPVEVFNQTPPSEGSIYQKLLAFETKSPKTKELKDSLLKALEDKEGIKLAKRSDKNVFSTYHIYSSHRNNLHYAIIGKDYDKLLALAKSNPSLLKQKDAVGNNPLHDLLLQFIKEKDGVKKAQIKEVVVQLINLADKKVINDKNSNKQNLLHILIKHRCYSESVLKALKGKIDLSQKTGELIGHKTAKETISDRYTIQEKESALQLVLKMENSFIKAQFINWFNRSFSTPDILKKAGINEKQGYEYQDLVKVVKARQNLLEEIKAKRPKTAIC